MLVEALQALLATDTGMLTILGTPSARPDSTNGIFPTQAPDQPTMPYLVYSQVSGEPMSVTMEGTGPLTTEKWRLSCYGTTYLKAKQFAKYVRRLALSWYGVQATGDVTVQGAFCDMEADDAEPLGKGTLFCTHLDFTFNYIDNDVS
jgi:hypothetical protein